MLKKRQQKRIKKDSESTLSDDTLWFPRLLPGLSLKFLVRSLRSPHRTQSTVWRSVCRSACSLILRSTWNTKDKETSHRYLSWVNTLQYMQNTTFIMSLTTALLHKITCCKHVMTNTGTSGEKQQDVFNQECKDRTDKLTWEDMEVNAYPACCWLWPQRLFEHIEATGNVVTLCPVFLVDVIILSSCLTLKVIVLFV